MKATRLFRAVLPVAFVTMAVAGLPASSEARAIVVGIGCRSVQECIDVAPDGATIRIPVGEYAEGILLNDKKLKLVGARSKTEFATLVPPRDAYAVQATSGHVVMRNLHTRGGYGIGVFRGDLVVKSVTVESSLAHGIVAEESTLTIKNTHVHGCGFYGIQTTGSLLNVEHATIDAPAADGVGMYIDNRNQPGIIFPSGVSADGTLNHLAIGGNRRGGLVIVGSHFDYTIKNSVFSANGGSGVHLASAHNTIVEHSSMTHMFPFVDGDPGADGLVTINCDNVLIDNVKAIDNDRAGIYVIETSGVVSNSNSADNQYGIAVNGATRPDYIGNGNKYAGTKLDILVEGEIASPSTETPIPPH